ncbi:excinuclease ABC subunit UvrC [Truepera radiovictrix]|uniref:UvrABC system protein C n=1 Tax=Truepera radiovictrix (strain DSM 17093 / CIP 108686 / LMG 22925 / RQ-24) TaxID=649638 RepID=D7CQV4_TRURR|nr:excinuclease ABC subunit UvrC [Truepera radiovictrix]ADI15088.1 excinuclease ABC, C subunit [Truepera radiovictrix DSM 17093]WMT56359.1 excinuclease ABC subunit UvrC [Truepera radiovictrix]
MTAAELPVLPTKPGCYLFHAPGGEVIYVGKAVNLRSRVRSYFSATAAQKAQLIRNRAERLEFIVTKSEVEALILEANLIKRFKPHYNVLLKDDKSYPFLKLTREAYPMLLFTRRVLKDGATYFGPYPNPGAVRKVQELVGAIFPLRQNSGVPLQKRKKPCLRFHMGRCLAPCIDNVSEEAYAKVVRQVRAFLEGDVAGTAEQLESEMRAAAARQDFELARLYRDRLQALQRLTGYDSDVTRASEDDLDFLGVAQAGNFAMVQLFQMRRGRVVGRDKRFLTNAEGASPAEILERFMADYYGQAMQVPPLVLVPQEIDLDVWSAFLSERAGKRVELRVPQRGDKVELMGMAERNAHTGLEAELALLERRGEAPGVKELQALVGLESAPYRIEGFDISNLMGTHTVASIVVFEGGRARKSEYRKMRITGLTRPDDFYAMHQAVYRRFTGALADKLPVPDLLLIDGGKGQLSAARRALKDAGLELPLLGLAKKQETIIREGAPEILVPETHPALRLLINIRDEAHRTAVGFNRKQRGAAMTRSVLDDIPGIGPARRDALLARFSSIDELKSAGVDELARIPGMGRVAAEAVVAFFSAFDNERASVLKAPEVRAAETGGAEAG